MDAYTAAIYLRLSKEDGDKEESNSIDSQRKLLGDYLRQQGDILYGGEYVDDGWSGTNFNRPAMQRMLSDIENRTINCVIVKDLSRFGRNYLDTGRYIQRIFPEMGVRFIAVNDNVDTADQSETGFDMILPIRNIINETYSQDISKKVQSSFKVMQHAGDFCGAYTSFGYMKDPNDKHKLVIDPDAAAVVRRVFDMYLSGVGQVAIAHRLNEEGIPSPSEYKRLQGLNYTNSNRLDATVYWTYSTVHRMLQNEMYCGNMVQGTTKRRMRGKAQKLPKDQWIIVKGTHDPIIDPEQFDRVQQLRHVRTRDLDFQSNESIFAGLLKCADCGRTFAKKHTRRNGKETSAIYYECGTYSRAGKAYCTPHRIYHEKLQEIILNDINLIISQMTDMQGMVERLEQSQKKKSGNVNQRSLTAKSLEKVRRQKRECYHDWKDGLISKEEYQTYHAEYEQKEQRLQAEMDRLAKLESQTMSEALRSPWIQQLLVYQKLTELDRQTVTALIDSIIVGEKDKNHQQKITIRYKFNDELETLFRMADQGKRRG